MKKKILKNLLFVATSVALCFIVAMTASAENYTGECGLYGDNLTWSLDTVTGELVISGEGEMADYKQVPYGVYPSWYTYRDQITSVSLGESVSSIGSYSFYRCEKIEIVDIPESVTSIKSCAFQACSSLRSLIIPNNVTSIEAHAFRGCYNLVSITLPIGITSLEGWLFSGCSSLEEIIIPENVTAIKGEVFLNCEKLKSIVIPEGVVTISTNAFKGCSGLESVVIPSTVKSIDTGSFHGCANIKNINVAKGNKYFYTDEYGALYDFSKKTLYRFPISEYTHYEINENVVQICSSAFQQCDNLKNVIIPEGVTQIGEGVFLGCENLESVILPDNVSQIEKYTFKDCSRLAKVTIGSGVQKINGEAFYNCTSLENLIIPSSIEYIGEFAFSNCRNIKEIKFCNGLKTISRYAFSRCNNIERVTLPDSLLSVDMGAFENCTNLKMIIIPDSVTDVSNSAFSFCRNLENVIIGNGIKSIGAGAFRACGVKHVGYTGTKVQWSNVSIGGNNEFLTDAPYFHNEFNAEIDIMEVITPATCCKEGMKSIVCSCGYIYSSEILSLVDCSFTVYESDYNATCLAEGTKTAYCDYGCGSSNTVTDEGSALGHDMSIYEVIKEATCTVNGKASVSCSRCDYFEIKEIIAESHKDKNHDGYCDYCSVFIADVNCICICHAKGIGAFIYKLFKIIDRILNTKLVLKVFGISDICLCGISHY